MLFTEERRQSARVVGTAAKAQRGGHGGTGWLEARAWDQGSDVADLLARGDGLICCLRWGLLRWVQFASEGRAP